MVYFLRNNKHNLKISILKNRMHDFFRINPFIKVLNSNKSIKNKIINDNVFKDHYISDSFCINWATSRFSDKDFHFGFTVSKKTISKCANQRNYIKRILKCLVQQNIYKYDVKGFDFVITARENIKNKKFYEIENEFNKTFKKIENKIKTYLPR